MVNAMRPGPADVMEQAALPYEFPVKRNAYLPGKGNRYRGNGNAVRHHILCAASVY